MYNAKSLFIMILMYIYSVTNIIDVLKIAFLW